MLTWGGMKDVLLRIAVIAALGLAPVCVAEPGEASFGLVDVERVLQESVIGKAARNNVELEAKKTQAKLQAAKEELQRMVEDFRKQGTLLSADALDQRRDQIAKKEGEFKGLAETSELALKRFGARETRKVIDKMHAILTAMVGKGTVVLERDPSVVLYADSSLELTDRVIAALDREAVGS